MRGFLDGAAFDLGGAAGHADTMRGTAEKKRLACAFLMNCLIICSVTVKSAITPSFIGRIAWMIAGYLPSICLASMPTARMVFLLLGAFLADGDDRGFVRHNALAAHVDQRVGGAKVNGEVIRKISGERTKHWAILVQFPISGAGHQPVGPVFNESLTKRFLRYGASVPISRHARQKTLC